LEKIPNSEKISDKFRKKYLEAFGKNSKFGKKSDKFGKNILRHLEKI